MKKRKLQRGDLYYYDFGNREGSIQSGIRPVLIVQADEFNANAPTIIVASITTVLKKKYLPSHIIIGKEFGLSKPSMVLLEQIQTINKDDLIQYIGTIDDKQLMKRINNSLKKTFGFWFYKPIERKDIHSLCPTCLNEYMQAKKYIVRRVNHFEKRKCKCEKCGRLGWEYTVTERQAKKK